MKSIKTVSSVVAILLVVGCSSQKAEPKIKNQTTLAEVKERMSRTLFDHVDGDRSRKISKDEFVAYQKEKNKLQERRQIDMQIESCDKNGDKQISLDEIPQRDQMVTPIEPMMVYEEFSQPCYMDINRFTSLDSNHDNIITFDELAIKSPMPMMPYPMVEPIPKDRTNEMETYIKKKYNGCDKNGDEKLTLNEATSSRCRIPSDEFIKADIDNDGFLTLKEVLDIAKKREEEQRLIHNNRPKIPHSAPKDIQLMMSMRKCDTDRDGKLSEAEMTSESCGFSKEDLTENDHDKDGYFSQKDMAILHILRNFKRMDRNKDKMLDFSEFKRNNRAF